MYLRNGLLPQKSVEQIPSERYVNRTPGQQITTNNHGAQMNLTMPQQANLMGRLSLHQQTGQQSLSTRPNPEGGQNRTLFSRPQASSSSYYGPSTSKATFGQSSLVKPESDHFQTNQLNRSATSSTNNNLGLMPFPKRNSNNQNTRMRTMLSESVSQNSTSDSWNKIKQVGETEEEKIVVLTGTVERVIKYGKIFQNQFCYFQVIGSVVSMAAGSIPFQNTILIKDKKGPIMQLIYYSNAARIKIEDFHLGQNLRAFGRMTGPNIMSAHCIRAATDEEIEILPRMCYISDYAISTLCGDVKKT